MLSGEVVTVRDLDTGAPKSYTLGSVLGAGAWRRVFDIGEGLVAKCGDIRSNRTEVQCWRDMRGTDAAKYLNPIVAVSDDYSVIIQPRVVTDCYQVWTEKERQYYRMRVSAGSAEEERRLTREWRDISSAMIDRVESFCNTVSSACRQYGWVPYDMKDSNTGIREDGSLVILDYGNFAKSEEVAA
jgi:hypothetical protein